MNRTEIDAITGEIIRIGEQNGIAIPMNSSIFLLIKAIETQGMETQLHK